MNSILSWASPILLMTAGIFLIAIAIYKKIPRRSIYSSRLSSNGSFDGIYQSLKKVEGVNNIKFDANKPYISFQIEDYHHSISWKNNSPNLNTHYPTEQGILSNVMAVGLILIGADGIDENDPYLHLLVGIALAIMAFGLFYNRKAIKLQWSNTYKEGMKNSHNKLENYLRS